MILCGSISLCLLSTCFQAFCSFISIITALQLLIGTRVHAFSPVLSSRHTNVLRKLYLRQKKCKDLSQRVAFDSNRAALDSRRAAFDSSHAGAAADDIFTVQILISDTGGGHRASANALRDAFDVLYPGKIACDIVDIYAEYGAVWPYSDYPAMYKRMAKYPFTWKIFYYFGTTSFGIWLNDLLLTIFCFASFVRCLNRTRGPSSKRADMVVSVHPLCQGIALKILAYLDSNGRTRDMSARKTPFCTVVTDLGSAHPTWFHPNVDKCYVPSDALNAMAQERGLSSSQIVQHGLPIRKGFWSVTDTPAVTATMTTTPAKTLVNKASWRKSLGLKPESPTVLVMGGGEGMGGLTEIAIALGNQLGSSVATQTQMVVICGKNKNAQKVLLNYKWSKGVEVTVHGFVDNINEWMKASDALVTKAGPGTIAEASICGLPCMLFSFLPGQEEGNIPFVEDYGFGKYSSDSKVIAETVSSWLQSPEKLETMQRAALNAARPHATLDIAKDLAETVLFTTRPAAKDLVLVKASE